MSADLSVVIAAYNASATIEAAVRSAVHVDARVVWVVDDGSTDDTAAIAIASGARVMSQANAGAAAARQVGAQRVDTAFITFLDADDELIADGVHRSISIIQSDPSLAVVAGRVLGVGRDGSAHLLKSAYTKVDTQQLLVTGFGAWPPGAAVTRMSAWRVAQTVQPAALNPRYAEDYESLIRCSMVGSVIRHDVPSLRYRMFGGKSVRSARSAIESKEAIRRHYAEALDVTITLLNARRVRAVANLRIARADLGERRYLSAAGNFVLAVIYRSLAALTPKRRQQVTQEEPGATASARRVAR